MLKLGKFGELQIHRTETAINSGEQTGTQRAIDTQEWSLDETGKRRYRKIQSH